MQGGKASPHVFYLPRRSVSPVNALPGNQPRERVNIIFYAMIKSSNSYVWYIVDCFLFFVFFFSFFLYARL